MLEQIHLLHRTINTFSDNVTSINNVLHHLSHFWLDPVCLSNVHTVYIRLSVLLTKDMKLKHNEHTVLSSSLHNYGHPME